MENGCSFFELENVQEFLRCFGQRQLGIVGNDEGSARELFLDVQGEEFTIVGYAVVRDKGGAETDAGKIDQEVVTASSISGTRSGWCCWKRWCRNSLVVLFRSSIMIG